MSQTMPLTSRSCGGAVAVALLCIVLMAALAGCSTAEGGTAPGGHRSAHLPPADPTVRLTDATPAEGAPERIIALDRAGSISRMVWALGLGDRLVGRDTATDFPGAADLPQITPGGHSVNAEAVLALQPDLILTDGTIGPSRVLETIADAGVEVIEIPGERTPANIRQLAVAVADAVGLDGRGEEVGDAIVAELDEATDRAHERADGRRMIVLYLRGTSIAMIGGPESGAGELIERLGGVDAAADLGIEGSFTSLTPEALAKAAPDTVIVMSHGLDSIGGPEGLNSLPGMPNTPAGANGSVLDVPDSQLLSFGPDTPRVLAAMADALYGRAGA